VPSLFTFHVDDPRIRGLEGVAAPAPASVKGRACARPGPVLVTHWGLSGPAILRLSAWGARELHAAGYRFTLAVNWAEPRTAEEARARARGRAAGHPRRQVVDGQPVRAAGAALGAPGRGRGDRPGRTWAGVSPTTSLRTLALQATASEFAVTGKSMNKEEFVTCGGVRLGEVDMATMESRLAPGSTFAGEVLDIDGITGGYNFQAAWTTGWQAGRAMAGE
jgi:predicted Rossmann fold flavoprotein